MSEDARSNTLESDIDALLGDPSKRAAILQRLGQLGDSRAASHLTPRGTTEGVEPPTSCRSGLTPSGTFQAPYGAFPHPAAWFPFPPFPPMFQPTFAWPNQQQLPVPVPQELTGNREPVPIRPQVQRTAQGDTDESDQEQPELEQEPEVVSLLDEDEAEQFREFEPEVSDPQSWKPPPSVEKYLDKHFNKLLADKDREAILKEFPVPDCDAVSGKK